MPPIRVLLLEDNATDILLIRETLAEAGSGQFDVEPVTRLADALERLAHEEFDVVLSDMGLPDGQGIEVVQRLNDRSPGTPIVVLTGRQDEDLGLLALRAGAQDWLTKGQQTGGALARALLYAIERREAEKLRAQQEQLREVSRQLWQTAKLASVGELAASIAHELNNPLAVVTLRLESLLADPALTEAQRRALEIVQQEAERMSHLVARLLEYSRRSAQQISTVDVEAEIEGTLDLVDYHLRSRKIEAVRDFAPVLPPIHADRQQLRQVFLNLFTNASDAMPQGGILTIRADTQRTTEAEARQDPEGRLASVGSTEEYLVVEVVDTGEGISPEHLERVTEPFFTTKEEGKGTGLGLAICQRILQEHGGSLSVMSQVGRGTTVRLLFPLARLNGTPR